MVAAYSRLSAGDIHGNIKCIWWFPLQKQMYKTYCIIFFSKRKKEMTIVLNTSDSGN